MAANPVHSARQAMRACKRGDDLKIGSVIKGD